MNRSGYKFVFIGLTGPMRPLAKAVIDEGLQDLFDFRGYVSNEDWLVHYMASDLCFAVTRDVGQKEPYYSWYTKILTPNKIFESMACGVPVVVKEGTLAAEMVRSLHCGIVLDVGHTSFSSELMRLSQNPEISNALGAAGREAFRLGYNWDEMQSRLLQLYAGVCALQP
jgi:glycosyltransferase involved in cell wall biosynthesis